MASNPTGTGPDHDTMFANHHLLFTALTLALAGPALAQRSPDEALRALQEGNQRFAAERSVAQPLGEGVRRTLARGQSPFAIVVTCADSDVPPEHLFNTGLGELVVVRTAGHVLGDAAIATIENAVQELDVSLCVVLGHENCDLVTTALMRSQSAEQVDQHLSSSVVHLLERIEPAVRKARALELGGTELQQQCQEEHAQATAGECLRRSELLRRYASLDKFRVVAARYHQSGEVEWLPQRPLPNDPEIDLPAMLDEVPAGVPPHVSLRMLRAGHRRFLGESRPEPDLTRARRDQVAAGQQPLAIVVTDSDSRVSPEHVFDAGLGELFVVRTAGNTLTDETLASIEFAAGRLGASLLVVMGHDRCELLASAAAHPEQQQLTPHQRELLKQLEPSAIRTDQAGEDALREAARRNVVRTVRETRSRSALLRTLEDEGRFAMLAALYDVGSGDLHWLKSGDSYERPAFVSSKHGTHEPEHGGEAAQHAAAHDAPTEHTAHAEHPPTAHDAHQPTAHSDEHGHAEPAHVDDPHADLPLMDFHAAPIGETAHPTPGAHDGNAHNDGGHDAHADHAPPLPFDEPSYPAPAGLRDHPRELTHDLVHDEAHPDDAGGHTEQVWQRWSDPVVVVGLVGIASLLCAAVLALKRS